MTAGFRSTEFWLTVCTWAVGLVLGAIGAWRGNLSVIVGPFLMAVALASYCHSRGRAKAPRPYLPPGGKL